MEDKVIDIQELAQDRHNFNRGNEEGQQLMERSFKELGAGRSFQQLRKTMNYEEETATMGDKPGHRADDGS